MPAARSSSSPSPKGSSPNRTRPKASSVVVKRTRSKKLAIAVKLAIEVEPGGEAMQAKLDTFFGHVIGAVKVFATPQQLAELENAFESGRTKLAAAD